MIRKATVKVPGSDWGGAGTYSQRETDMRIEPFGDRSLSLQMVNPHVPYPGHPDEVEDRMELSEAEAVATWQVLSQALGKTDAIMEGIERLRKDVAQWPRDRNQADAEYVLELLLGHLIAMGVVPKTAGLRWRTPTSEGQQPAPAAPEHDEFRHYAPSAKAGVLHIRSLPNDAVLAAARDRNSAAFQELYAWMEAQPKDRDHRPSFPTNASWVTARCAEEAYRRELIDERELDRLMEVAEGAQVPDR
jgi:hypothetical protein